MSPNENRRSGGQPGDGGGIPSSGSAKVIQLRPNDKGGRPGPFDQLTARLVLDQYRAGTLPEGVLVAMMAASAGLRP